MSNLITLADARSFLQPFVDGGTCDNTVIDLRVREAEERLWAKSNWRMSLRRIKVRLQNQVFSLPHEVQKILAIDFDGAPANVFTQAYEYLAGGLGSFDERCVASPFRNAVDEGEFPTQFDVPIIVSHDDDETCCDGTVGDDYYLIAFSTDSKDSAQYLTIRGYGVNNDEVRTEIDGELAPGERVRINQWAFGVEGSVVNISGLAKTVNTFRQVTRVYKPVTRSSVTLYAYNPTNGAMYLLSKMTPDETVPSYRRYRVTNMANDNSSCTCATMLVRVGFRPATRADDVLTVQSLSALKLMIMALAEENAGNTDKALNLETNAFRVLLEQKEAENTNTPMITVFDQSPRLGLGALGKGVQ